MFKVQRHKSYLLKKRTHTLYENALKKIMFLFIEAVISTKKIRFVLKRQYLLLKFRYSEKATNFLHYFGEPN